MIFLNDENFEEEIKKSEKPILVDFFAEWCPPCSFLSPVLDKLEKEFEGRVSFAKVNVDLAPQTCLKFGINPIPTVILFKEGKIVDWFVGVKSELEIKNWLEEKLKN